MCHLLTLLVMCRRIILMSDSPPNTGVGIKFHSLSYMNGLVGPLDFSKELLLLIMG